MGVCELVSKYAIPFGVTALALLAAAIVMVLLLGRRQRVPPVPVITAAYLGALLLAGGLIVVADRVGAEERMRSWYTGEIGEKSNLVANARFTDFVSNLQPASWTISGTAQIALAPDVADGEQSSTRVVRLDPGSTMSSNLISVRSGATYRYSFVTMRDPLRKAETQVRMLWLDKALGVVAWNDSAPLSMMANVDHRPMFWPRQFWTGTYRAPEGAAYLQLEMRNLLDTEILIETPGLWQEGVYIEPHPNGTQGSLAFSFDWESAMGGAIHSRGMEAHDPAGAAQHGLDMREGADWLGDLFADNAIRATFYGNGYNLLDGNTEHRTFAGDPIYDWASPRNRWSSDYWLTHKWYSDDPYGTYETHPAWYFGDQTSRLAEAGHEIASHTFGHLYVRGATPEQLASDADEWNAAARAMDVLTPTTFAFPWRSSNSLTPDFYDVLYKRGIRAVTRIYPLDVKDHYTIGAVGVYSDIAVMPDFLLGTPSDSMDEEAGGGGISMEEGLRVLAEIGRRRGTTSFWQHPEQLADRPEFEEVREPWSVVVGAAARERDRGRLWIATVAEITTYQRDLMSVNATLECGLGGWKVRVNNALDRPISGVTLTLPGDVKRVASSEVSVSTVYHPEAGVTRVTSPGQGQYPARQLVLNDLEPGTATIDVEWAPGQEPLR